MVKYRIKSRKEIESFLREELSKRTTDFYFPEEMFFFCGKILTKKYSTVYSGSCGDEINFKFKECGWHFIERWGCSFKKEVCRGQRIMFKKYDKVYVLSKSTGGDLENSFHYCKAKKIKQKFLYYIGIKEEDKNVHLLSHIPFDDGGDYYLITDFVKYTEKTKFVEILESSEV